MRKTPKELTVTLTSAEVTTICDALEKRMEKLWEQDSDLLQRGGINHPARRGVQTRLRTCMNLCEDFTLGLLNA